MKPAGLIRLSFLVFGFVLITAYPLWGRFLIGSIYRRQSLSVLNRFIDQNTSSPLETYLRIGDTLWFSFLFWTAWMLALGFLVVYLLKHRGRRQVGFRVRAAVFMSTLLALCVGGELFVRFYDSFRWDIPLHKSISLYRDDLLGWSGKKYFGDPETKRLKIFIVGDSFTAGGSPAMYYETLKNELGAELFVYGGTGYGTLQEFFVIDKYLDRIKPDLILLQVCANDFINNHWELGSKSCFENHPMVRPYYDTKGTVSYRYPGNFGETVYFLALRSRLAYRLIVMSRQNLVRLAKIGKIYTVENDIEKQGLNFGPYRESFEVTRQIIGRIKDRVGETPMVAFTVSEGPSRDHFGKIFAQTGIPFIASIPDRIVSEESIQGKLRLGDGAHWNQKGHRVAGAALLQELVDNGFLPKSSRR